MALPGSGAEAASAPGTFYLLTSRNPEGVRTHLPLLDRELFRQGLLIAARDGLGMQTRDESLREWAAPPAAGMAWNLRQGPLKIEITDGKAQSIWTTPRPASWQNPLEIASRVSQIETSSRGPLFVKLLQEQGYSGQANQMKPGAAASVDSEKLLADLDELSQFRVLRQVHDAIRKDGESEARLGVLVRGYANLGQLTRYHWSLEHQVFTARSLLYAARMVNANPRSPVALWHRAYAMALAGFQEQTFKRSGRGRPCSWQDCRTGLGGVACSGLPLPARQTDRLGRRRRCARAAGDVSGISYGWNRQCNMAMLNVSFLASGEEPAGSPDH